MAAGGEKSVHMCPADAGEGWDREERQEGAGHEPMEESSGEGLDEARPARSARDPGAPTKAIIAAHAMMSTEARPDIVGVLARNNGNMGHTHVVIKSDNEPAMRALAVRVKEVRTHPMEESPEYEPESNGLADRYAQTANGLLRTARSALEDRIGCAAPDDHNVLTWLVRRAPCPCNRRWVDVAAEFGESVMFMTKGPRKERQWSFGTWPGRVALTREAWIGTPDGVARPWTIKRTGEQDMWSKDDVLAIRGTTLRPDPAPGR